MVQQGHFMPDDPYQRASFQAIYIPILQEIVNEWIGICNLHRVRLINGQGRFRPSHVPARYFQEFERLHGWAQLDHKAPFNFLLEIISLWLWHWNLASQLWFNRWTSHIEDRHVQDNQEHIGSQDLGPQGLRTWVARRTAPNSTLFDIPDLSPFLVALRDSAYNIGKVGKDVLQCFHLHYFMSHYCYLSQDSGIPVGHLVPLEHSTESLEAFHLLVSL